MKRFKCKKCLRPIVTCYCHLIKSFSSDSNIVILQHPSEQKHTLGTAKIADSCFENCKIIIGENFSDNEDLNFILKNHNCALVFPTKGEAINKDELKSIDTFIFLDGTWKKAKKIIYLNPQIANLPKVKLNIDTPSRYKIRKVPKENYLSTLEAICWTLKEADGIDAFEVIDILDFIQDKQIQMMGKETFDKNYN